VFLYFTYVQVAASRCTVLCSQCVLFLQWLKWYLTALWERWEGVPALIALLIVYVNIILISDHQLENYKGTDQKGGPPNSIKSIVETADAVRCIMKERRQIKEIVEDYRFE